MTFLPRHRLCPTPTALVSSAAILLLLLTPRLANAAREVGADGKAVAPLRAHEDALHPGAGYQFAIALPWIEPEVGDGFDWYSSDGGGGSEYAWDMQRVVAEVASVWVTSWFVPSTHTVNLLGVRRPTLASPTGRGSCSTPTVRSMPTSFLTMSPSVSFLV
jgi:hypothetical protein